LFRSFYRIFYPTLSNGITLHPLSCGRLGGSGGGALGMALSMKLVIISYGLLHLCSGDMGVHIQREAGGPTYSIHSAATKEDGKKL